MSPYFSLASAKINFSWKKEKKKTYMTFGITENKFIYVQDLEVHEPHIYNNMYFICELFPT